MVILKVRQAQHCDRDELARMRLLLWPDGSFEEHLTELDAALNNRVSGNLPATIFVSHNENGRCSVLSKLVCGPMPTGAILRCWVPARANHGRHVLIPQGVTKARISANAPSPQVSTTIRSRRHFSSMSVENFIVTLDSGLKR